MAGYTAKVNTLLHGQPYRWLQLDMGMLSRAINPCRPTFSFSAVVKNTLDKYTKMAACLVLMVLRQAHRQPADTSAPDLSTPSLEVTPLHPSVRQHALSLSAILAAEGALSPDGTLETGASDAAELALQALLRTIWQQMYPMLFDSAHCPVQRAVMGSCFNVAEGKFMAPQTVTARVRALVFFARCWAFNELQTSQHDAVRRQ